MATILNAKNSSIKNEKDYIENHIQRLHKMFKVVDTKIEEREEK